MIGKYTSIGIVVKPDGGGLWSLRSPFQDAGFCDNASSEGTVHLRYCVADLATGIDTLKADVERLGIAWQDWGEGDGRATLYMEGDGESKSIEYPPDWREVLRAQAERLEWCFPYQHTEMEPAPCGA